MKYDFYIAAPFFNPAQVAIVKAIEDTMNANCIPFFSPRLLSQNKTPGPLTKESAAEIFERDVDAMDESLEMIAVIDWALPAGEKVFWMQQNASGTGKSKDLNIPDAGTVFEMGYAHANKMDVIIYTERPASEGVNLMLTQGAKGIIRSTTQLDHYLKHGDSALSTWEGGFQ